MKTAENIFIYIAVMALVTYLIRMLPLVIFRKKIENRFIRSFLYYIPYAVLAAMTFPAAVAGLIVALLLAFFEKGLLTVALSSCVAVFVIEFLIKIIS